MCQSPFICLADSHSSNIRSQAVLQASIKVQGSNGRNQMLKVWLPGLVHLIGDHSKTAVDKETDIKELLDSETGLRILTNE